MLESLFGGYKGSNLFLDISFEDSEVGSTDLYDKVSKTILSTRRSTRSGTTESSVVDHETYGRVMSVGSGRVWWLNALNPPLPGLVIELEMAMTSLSSQENFFLNTGGWNGSVNLPGYGVEIISTSYGMGVSFFPANSGSSNQITVPRYRMATFFIEHRADGRSMTYGIRGTTPIAGPYDSNESTGLYIGAIPFWTISTNTTFLVNTLGFLKSIKMYKK